MIVVSLTTIPSRIKLLPTCLKSIQVQSLLPDIIYIHVPKVSRRGIPYDLQLFHNIVAQFPVLNIVINQVPVDYGPITKLYPLFDVVNEPNASLILIDDDVQYSQNMIQTLVNNQHLLACGFVGLNTELKWRHTGVVEFLETYHGVLYKRKLFPYASAPFLEWYLKIVKDEPTCANTDDIIIGYWIRKQGYELKVIPNSSVKVIHDAADTEQLRNTNLKGGNKVCYDFIKTQENNVFIIITLLLFLVVGTQYPISGVFFFVAFFLVAFFSILKVGY